jgi:hypothetical protein
LPTTSGYDQSESAPLRSLRARATPRPSTQTNIGEASLVDLPTRMDVMEKRRFLDWQYKSGVVSLRLSCWCNPRHAIPSTRCVRFRYITVVVSRRETAQTCSKWGPPPPPTSGQRPGGEIVQAQYDGRRAGRRFLRQSQPSPNTRAFMRSPWRAHAAAPRSPARLDTRTLLLFCSELLGLPPKSSIHHP